MEKLNALQMANLLDIIEHLELLVADIEEGVHHQFTLIDLELIFDELKTLYDENKE